MNAEYQPERPAPADDHNSASVSTLMSQQAARIKAFDGLRGVWAFGVMLSHVAALVYVPWVDTSPPAHWSYALWHLGAPAVDGFFVLSGLVLCANWERSAHYRRYLWQRVKRIYPVGVFSALLGLSLGRWAAAQLPVFPGGIAELLNVPVGWQDLAGVLTFIGIPYNADAINPPLWSLAPEMIASALMPLLVWLARTWGWISLPLLMVACLGLAFRLHITAVIYLPMFLLGVLIQPVKLRLPTWAWGVIAAIGTAVLYQRFWSGSYNEFLRYLTAPGAAMLLLAVRAAPMAWLESRLFQWLGKISFALYAVHFPLLILGAALMPQHVALGAALMIPAALLAASLLNHWTQPHHTRTKEFA